MLIIVNQPNRHHVLYKYAHYIVIVRHEFRLYYYEHGALVRGFDVALGRPGYRTPLGHFRIYGKRKPAGVSCAITIVSGESPCRSRSRRNPASTDPLSPAHT